ncbi:MAG: glycosyltransferase family 87 protein [Chloroflexota bacterium]
MTIPAAQQADGVRRRLLLAEMLGVALAALAWLFTLSKVVDDPRGASDFTAYFLAGQAHLLGLDYYQRATIEGLAGAAGITGDLGPYLYPPLFAVIMSPLAGLDYPTARLLWAALSLLALAGGVVMLQWAVGLRLPLGTRGPALALVSLFPPVADDIIKGQITAVLLCLLAGAWLAEKRRQPVVAGLLVAIAASIKLVPAIILLYFLLRRDYRALCAGIVGGAALVAASVLAAGVESHFYYTTQQVPYIGLQVRSLANVSLVGAAARLLPADLFTTLSTLVNGAIWLGLFTVLAIVVRRETAGQAHGLGFALAVLAVLLGSPSSRFYTLVLAFLPLAAIAAYWRGPKLTSRLLVDAVLISILFLSIPADQLPVPADTSGPRLALALIPTVGLLILGSVITRLAFLPRAGPGRS